MSIIEFSRKTVALEHEHFTVYEDGSLIYKEAGRAYYEALFRGANIPINLINTYQEHRSALSVALEPDLKPLRAKVIANELSLEGEMLLAIIDSDDNTKAWDIQARIERRDSWKLV